MMKILELKVEINSVEHLKDKSCYNHNFYKIVENHPWWSLQGNDVVEEVCHEDENYYTFALGHFDQNGEFVSILEWESETGCKGIEDYIHEAYNV